MRQNLEIRLRDYRVYYHGLYDEGRPGWVRAQAALREFGALLKADGTPATLLLLPELHERAGSAGSRTSTPRWERSAGRAASR